MGAFTYRTAHVVDMLMMQDGEEPSPQIGAVLPEMLLGDSPGQAVLHEIVGPREIPGQYFSLFSTAPAPDGVKNILTQ